jgi:hypothetical protein
MLAQGTTACASDIRHLLEPLMRTLRLACQSTSATTKQFHTFRGQSQFVKKGVNVMSVYLATSTHTLFPGTTASTKRVMVK